MGTGKKHTFVQRRPTSWLDPVDITRTGLQTFLAGLFGSFADKREVLAALYPNDEPSDYSKDPKTKQERDEIWFDYICDTGDGWNPTYSIACLVGQDELVGLADIPLPRGEFMVLGGDQVYPVASSEQYRERFDGPFFGARATTEHEAPGKRAKVYALPGNHDWYDGLASFIRLFGQKDGRVGQWSAAQSRSYFAIKLPHGWWIWGLDVQLESDLDAPQIAYFTHYAEQLNRGDCVILVSPEPTWIEAGRVAGKEEKQLLVSLKKARDEAKEAKKAGKPPAPVFPPEEESEDTSAGQTHRNMQRLEQLIHKRRASIPIKIAGDLHHYARYLGADGNTQLITCGGGGAFLHGTYGLPKALDLQASTGQAFSHEISVPTEDESKAMRGAVMWKLFRRNKWFAVAVGAIYWIYSWLLQSASEALDTLPWKLQSAELLKFLDKTIPALPKAGAPTLLDYLRATWPAPPARLFHAWSDIVLRDPLLFFFTALIIVGCGFFGWSFARPVPKSKRWGATILGGLHGAAHIALAVFLISIAVKGIRVNWLVHSSTFLMGAIPGTILMSAYLWLSNVLFGGHDQEVLSTQAIEDYKCFARFKVTKDLVTIYPVGLRVVCKKWELASTVTQKAPEKGSRGAKIYRDIEILPGTKRVFEPVPRDCLKPQLLEEPIRVLRPQPTPTGSPSPGSPPDPE